MRYKLYKLTFQGAVHFGRHSIADGEYSCCADTLFSALCQEAVKSDKLQDLYGYAKDGNLILSDLFPYIGDTCYIPKPMKRIDAEYRSGDSELKKAYKKLKYIPMDLLDVYMRGEYEIGDNSGIDGLGYFEMKRMASIRGRSEPEPYGIGTYYFKPGNGLYFILGYQEEKVLELMEALLESLSFSGIGGKRASGIGRFELFWKKVPDKFCERLEKKGARYMSLSVSLPTDEELERALDGAEYLLLKRSGFVESEQYAQEQRRKKDLYVFQSGSCFTERFCGDIYDVSEKGYKHPVYRYAKPMLVEV